MMNLLNNLNNQLLKMGDNCRLEFNSYFEKSSLKWVDEITAHIYTYENYKSIAAFLPGLACLASESEIPCTIHFCNNDMQNAFSIEFDEPEPDEINPDIPEPDFDKHIVNIIYQF